MDITEGTSGYESTPASVCGVGVCVRVLGREKKYHKRLIIAFIMPIGDREKNVKWGKRYLPEILVWHEPSKLYMSCVFSGR